MTGDFNGLYTVVFVAVALGLLLLEQLRALQRQPAQIARRWTSNIALLLVGVVVSTAVLPIGIYAFAQQRGATLLSRPDVPLVLQLVLTFLLLDAWKYWEHRAFHTIPLLWRLHLVHHSDTAVDVTTTERHHPLEVIVSTALLIGLVALLGLPAPGLAIYLLAATVVTLCSHANLNVAQAAERPLRRLVVTPAFHAIHHSAERRQTDSNFGLVLTIWDRLFGTYVDPDNAKVRHFGLTYFHLADDTRLARVLLQPFMFRRDLSYPPRTSSPPDADAAAASIAAASEWAWIVESRRALVAGALGCALVVIAMWPAVATMTATWRNSESSQFAWLVLPMVVYVVGWHIRPPVDVRPDFSGIGAMALAAICWIAATLMNIDVGRQIAFVLALQGVAMSTFGWRSYCRLFPALALLFLMVPPGDLAEPALRTLTLRSIELVTTVAQLPHTVDGFVIHVGARRYVVIDACSGLTYVTLATFLGYSFGLLIYRSFFKIAALALGGALVGIAVNAFRVNAIVLIDAWRGSQMDLAGHGAFQWIALFAALGALLVVLRRLDPDPAPDAPAGTTTYVRSIAYPAPVIVALIGVVAAGCALALQSDDPSSQDPALAASLPVAISGWELDTAATTQSIDAERRLESVEAVYVRDGRSLQVVAMETLRPQAKLPEWRLAPDAQPAWRDKRLDRATGCAGSRCLAFVHVTWERDKTHSVRHVYYAFAIGSWVTDSRFALRAMHGWRRLNGDHAHPRLILFIADDALDPAELALAFERFADPAQNI